MTTRRGGRASHVRPRPPSTGRPTAAKVRARPIVTSRVATRQRAERRPSLPVAARIVLVAAILALGAVVTYTATGGLGQLVGSLGTSLGGFLDDLTATPEPSASLPVLSDAPVIAPPGEPITNESTVDLLVTVPLEAVGEPNARVRIYLALLDQAPAPILEVPVGSTRQIVIPVELTEGRNDITATIVGLAGESDPSPVVTYHLDQTPPTITLSSPKNGAVINRATVELKGTTQAKSMLIARNAANSASVSGEADGEGIFTLTLPLDLGTNAVTVTATDPAGNSAVHEVSVQRGSGQLSAALSASAYRVSVSKLPQTIELSVVVTDPDGRRLPNAAVTFTLSVPNIAVVVHDTTTNRDGRATLRTTISTGAVEGGGLATVLVTTTEFGQVSDRTVITFIK